MTGYTVHTGSSVKFSSGWDNIFGGSCAEGHDRREEEIREVANQENGDREEEGRAHRKNIARMWSLCVKR